MASNVTTETAADSGMDSFAALFEQSVEGGDFAREGEIITGTVVHVDRDSVVVDIGGKSEGVIALREFADTAGGAYIVLQRGTSAYLCHSAPRQTCEKMN